MTLRDKVDEAFKNAHTASGLRCETILSDTLLKNQLNAVMEVLDDYEALVEAVAEYSNMSNNKTWRRVKETLQVVKPPTPPKLSDRLDELVTGCSESLSTVTVNKKELREIASELKEKGL